jgi:hypothetical protein
MTLANGEREQRKAVTAQKGAGSAESCLALDRDISRHIWAKTRPIPHPKEAPDGRGCEDSIDIE